MGRRESITSETCRSCGLCCISPEKQDFFCDVSEADVRKLGPRWTSRNVSAPSFFDRMLAAVSGEQLPFGAILTKCVEPRRGPLKGSSLCACVALRGTPGASVTCTVYERRPKTCHTAVKPGDSTCRNLRKFYLEK